MGAVYLTAVYQRDERFQFIRQRYHAGSGAADQQAPPGLQLQDQYVHAADNDHNSESASIAALAYRTAPFDIPYAKIECQPCSKASHLMNPLAPYAIIGGAMKGGTRALLTYLSQHPDVYSHQGKEMHMLDNSKIKVFASREDPVCNQCKVLETYREVYKERKRSSMLPHNEKDKDLIFFDKSPSYMVMSHITPQRVICAFPKRPRSYLRFAIRSIGAIRIISTAFISIVTRWKILNAVGRSRNTLPRIMPAYLLLAFSMHHRQLNNMRVSCNIITARATPIILLYQRDCTPLL